MTDVPRSPARGTQRQFAAAHADVRNLAELRRVVGNASAALGAWGYEVPASHGCQFSHCFAVRPPLSSATSHCALSISWPRVRAADDSL